MGQDLVKNRDIVIVGQQPWDVGIGSNCKDIALEFSKNNRVLYVNSPLDRITRFKRKDDPIILKRMEVLTGKRNGLTQQKDNLWELNTDGLIESINWIKIHNIFNILNKRN
ncbi:glycosyl transferase family 1, partial [Pedobacter sp. HMWF019]